MKTLLTCEKPDVAKMIADVVDVSTKNLGGYFEGDDYVITWGFGHMISLKQPHEINEKWKSWDLQDLPLKFDYSKDLKVESDKLKQLNIVKKLVNRNDISLIINCGDADREGLLIQEEMYAFSGCKKEIKVLWADGLSKDSVIKSLNNLHDRDEFLGLLDAGKGRAITDWLYGMNYSRAIKLTLYNYSKDTIAYGRCQTPVLKLMVDRELEIKNFQVKDYYQIESTFDKGYKGLLIDKDKNIVKYDKVADAENDLKSIDKVGEIVDYKVEKKSQKPPMLFSLLTLQKTMSGLYSADKTLSILQKLYEKGLVSYPRTDTEYIDEGTFDEIEKRLMPAITHFNIKRDNLADFNSIKSIIVKPKKVASHFAIIPTERVLSDSEFNELSKDEQIILETIYKRLIALLMPDYEYESITIITKCGNYNFITKGTNPLKLGFKELYVKDVAENSKDKEDDEEENVSIPKNLKNGDKVNVINLEILIKKTEPPKRYTTSSLLSLMKSHGIGRPSTYAEIIKRLEAHGYIKLSSKKYFCSDLAIDYMSKIPAKLVDVELTKKFEEKLDLIDEKKYSLKELLNDTEKEQVEMINTLKELSKTTTKFEGKKSEYVCPNCNKPLQEQKFTFNCECGFKLSKSVASKEIPDKEIDNLLKKGKTGLIKGFKKKDGGTFNCALKLDKKTGKVEFDFTANKKK